MPPKASTAAGRSVRILGPGLITGASDDDPSGIATYSQAGAQFGTGLGWTLFITVPLMCAIQEISAHVGRVTGKGLAGNLRQHYPRPVLYGLVLLLAAANTINLGADLGAMGAALKLIVGGPQLLYVAGFAVLCSGLEIFTSYKRYAAWLKWLSLSLFAYVATLFTVSVPWPQVLHDLVVPRIALDAAYLTVVVAVFGTTISPYLFFWQAQEEAEDEEEDPDSKPLTETPEQASREFRRIRIDTYVGMVFSNIVALCIVVTTAVTLHVHGVTNIQTSAQAAQALRPIAGAFAFAVFALGIIGTGLLAVPVLAGSAAFAIGETFGWRVGLARKPSEARAFYAAVAALTLVGGAINVTPIDPVKALFWSAVINGVVAVPVMAMMMLIATRKDTMASLTVRGPLKAFGWLATLVMALAAVGMFATMGF